METRKISITSHARQRLAERMPDVHRDCYNGLVHTARYSGLTLSDLEKEAPELAVYIAQQFKGDNSTQIRYYRKCVFIFKGNKHKSHTLVTVINLTDLPFAQ